MIRKNDKIIKIRTDGGEITSDPSVVVKEMARKIRDRSNEIANPYKKDEVVLNAAKVVKDTSKWALTTVDTSEVFHHLTKTRKKMSAGVDGVPSKLIWQLRYQLTSHIMEITNSIINNAKWPRELGIAKVIPVPKQKPFEIRGISIVTALANVMAKIIGTQLADNIERRLPENLYGGIRGRSTADAILRIREKIIKSCRDKQSKVAVVAVDAKAAFDTKPHPAIMDSLETYGASKATLALIASHLRSQSQYVEFEGVRGELQACKGKAVFQGGAWSSILYNVAKSGQTQHECIPYSAKYLDDELEIVVGAKGNIQSMLSEKIEQKSAIFSKSGMSIEETKTEILTVNTTGLEIKRNNMQIIPKNQITWLGYVLQSNLKVNAQVDKVNTTLKQLQDGYGASDPFQLRSKELCTMHLVRVLSWSTLRPTYHSSTKSK